MKKQFAKMPPKLCCRRLTRRTPNTFTWEKIGEPLPVAIYVIVITALLTIHAHSLALLPSRIQE